MAAHSGTAEDLTYMVEEPSIIKRQDEEDFSVDL